MYCNKFKNPKEYLKCYRIILGYLNNFITKMTSILILYRLMVGIICFGNVWWNCGYLQNIVWDHKKIQYILNTMNSEGSKNILEGGLVAFCAISNLRTKVDQWINGWNISFFVRKVEYFVSFETSKTCATNSML